MKLSVHAKNIRRTKNLKKTYRHRTYHKLIQTGGHDIVWKDTGANIQIKETIVELSYKKEGSLFGSKRFFSVILRRIDTVLNPPYTSDDLLFNVKLHRRTIFNTEERDEILILSAEFILKYDISIEKYTFNYVYNNINSVLVFSKNGVVANLELFPKSITVVYLITNMYHFDVSEHTENKKFFISLAEQMYQMYVIKKGGPLASFVNILTIHDETLLLSIIYSNLNVFITSLMNNEQPHKMLDGVKPDLTVSPKSYWKGVRIMGCFKNQQFNYIETIINIFATYFNANYNAKQQECAQINYGNYQFPFKCIKKLGKGGKIGTPYTIQYKSPGKNIIMKITKNIHLNVNVMCSPQNNTKCEVCKDLQFKKRICFPKTNDIQYIVKSSEYINETIIGYVLNTIFFPKHNSSSSISNADVSQVLDGELFEGELGNSVYQIGHFQSNDNYGANLMEKADGELDELFNNVDTSFDRIQIKYDEKSYCGNEPSHKNIIISMLLLQLSNTLKKVSDNLGMIHGDLKAGNVFYSIKNSYMNVDYPLNTDINIRTNIRLKIADYGKSSIIYNGVRFYCGSYKTRFVPEEFKYNDYAIDDSGYYSYDYSTSMDILPISVKVAHQLRHIKCPYFRSFDLYCVMISLAIQSVLFRDFYIENKIGDILFNYPHVVPTGSSYKNVDDPVQSFNGRKFDKPKSISFVFTELNNKKLNCGAIELCIDKYIKIFDSHVDTYCAITTESTSDDV